MNRADELRLQILSLVEEYAREAFPSSKEFIAGTSAVAVSGRVFDAADVQMLVNSSLDFWLTAGRFSDQFERKFARRFGSIEQALAAQGKRPQDSTLAEMDALWDAAKATEKAAEK